MHGSRLFGFWLLALAGSWAIVIGGGWLIVTYPLQALGVVLGLLLARAWVIAWDAT
jgi:hypothetical protein